MKFMNKFSTRTTAFMLLTFGLTSFAFAGDPITLNITGNILASPCEVDGTGTVPVNLGENLQSADFQDAETSSAWVPFSVSLKNCPAGTSSVTATFGGTADTSDPNTLYVNTGTATNVAVQLEGKNSEPYGNGKTSTLDISSGVDPKWDLQARAYSSAGGVTPGTINASVTRGLTYN